MESTALTRNLLTHITGFDLSPIEANSVRRFKRVAVTFYYSIQDKTLYCGRYRFSNMPCRHFRGRSTAIIIRSLRRRTAKTVRFAVQLSFALRQR